MKAVKRHRGRILGLALLGALGWLLWRGVALVPDNERLAVERPHERLRVYGPGLNWVGFGKRQRLSPTDGPRQWTLVTHAELPAVIVRARWGVLASDAELPVELPSLREQLLTLLASELPSEPLERIRTTHDFVAMRRLEQSLVDVAAAAGYRLGDLELVFTDPGRRLESLLERALRERAEPGWDLVLLGLDGFDPRVADDLVRAGLLPNWARLRASSAWGMLRAQPPLLSPLLWTSLATGLPPHQHGVLDFVQPAGDGLQAIGSVCRTARPLWQLASLIDRDVALVNWWASAPVEPALDAWLLSDRAVRARGLELPQGALYPDDAHEFLAASAPAPEQVEQALSTLLRIGSETAPPPQDERLETLRSILDEALRVQRLTLGLMRERDPDVLMSYLGLPDQAAHLFLEAMPPRLAGVSDEEYRRFGGVVHGSYMLIDAWLGAVLERLEDDSLLVIVSDHGFAYGEERLRLEDDATRHSDRLHSPWGVYLLHGPAFVEGPGPTLDLLDIAPLLARVLGLPMSSELPGQLPRSLLRAEQLPPEASIATWQLLRERPGWPPLARDGKCGGETVGASGDDAWLDRLQALGYLAGADLQAGWEPFLARRHLARSLLDSGLVGEARRALDSALALRPDDAWARWDLVALLLASGDMDAALEQCRWLSERASSAQLRQDAWLLRVELLVLAGRGAEAAELLAGWSGLDAGWQRTLAAGLVAAAALDPDAAIRLWSEALAAGGARALDALTGWLELDGLQPADFERLARVVRRAPLGRELMVAQPPLLPRDPERARDYLMAALSAEQRGEPLVALALVRRALSHDSRSSMLLASYERLRDANRAPAR